MIPRFARKTITLGGVVRTFIREKTIMAAGKEKERLNLNSEIDGIGYDCPESPRVLSIQSHVVSGYVGNKSAVFPLQVLGFEVDFINSVQFSNHTGYAHFKGQILDAEQLGQLMDGLVLNGLHKKYTHLLTGYIGSTSFLERVAEVVKVLKKANPSLVYVCDPVMGDDGKLYVTPDLLPIYQKTILPLADIVTPNQFEAELLTGMKITDKKSALEAIDAFHAKGVKTVVLSSTDYGGDDDTLLGLGSQRSSSSSSPKRLQVRIPRLDANFTGTGDLFAALLTAWHHRHPQDLKLVLQKVLGTMESVLKRTAKMALRHSSQPNVEQLELKLVQSIRDIEEPSSNVDVTEIE